MRSKIWDIGTSDEYEDRTTTKYEYRQYFDKNNVSTPGLRDFTFEVNEPDSFILPSNAYIVGSVKVVKDADGTSFGVNDVVVLCQNFACAFFQKAEYLIGEQLVESQDYVHMKTHLKGLIEFSTDHTFSHTTDQLWFPDNGSGSASLLESSQQLTVGPTPFAVTGTTEGLFKTSNSSFNSGFKKRLDITSSSKKVYFRAPLARLFDIHKHVTHVFRGARHTIRLLRQSSNNQLLYRTNVGADVDGRVDLLSLNLWMPICVPELAKFREIEDTLSKAGPMSISYPLSQAYRSQVFTDTTGSPRWNVATLTERPSAIYIFCQVAERVTTTTQVRSRFIFDNLGLTRARVMLGSATFPEQEIRTNFTTNEEDYVRAFHDLLAISQPMGDPSSGGLINLSNYKTLYPIIAVDLSAQSESLFAPGSVAELTVELELSNTDGSDYHIWAVVDSSRKLNYNIVDKRVLVSRA